MKDKIWGKIWNFVLLARPFQWQKNIFVFAPVFFSFSFEIQKLIKVFWAFLSFVLVSSSVYSINDIIDLEKDRAHPIKSKRPVASQKISKNEALTFALLLFIISLIIGYVSHTLSIIVAYFLLNILYSLFFKGIEPLGIFSVAFGFVLRVFAGGLAAKITPSSWLTTSTFFISLFISSMKREAEEKEHSKIYEHIGVISATLTIIFYTLYIIFERRSFFLLISIIPVMFGIIRYYIISEEQKGKDPSLLIVDPQILIAAFIWGVMFVLDSIFPDLRTIDFSR
ncbi:MAG: UbiA prenyltransferase family protein [Candidatus Calescibacterium sp.]|jgi:4-hydroxybenzoate polyprenyltransferase|nr:UbiA prenyltransferase family protein [Candidatus Calescibacterium sp.]